MDWVRRRQPETGSKDRPGAGVAPTVAVSASWYCRTHWRVRAVRGAENERRVEDTVTTPDGPSCGIRGVPVLL